MDLNFQMLSVTPPCRASCDCVVEEIKSRAWLEEKDVKLPVVVPIPSPPKKKEDEVDVEIKLPTVNCDVVAIRVVPRESETKIEFSAKAKEFVPPLATGRVPVTCPVSET